MSIFYIFPKRSKVNLSFRIIPFIAVPSALLFVTDIILFPFQLKNLWLTDHGIRKEDLAIHISGSVWFRKLMREYDNHPSNAGPIIRFTMNILSSRWHLMKWKSGHWFSRFLTMISFPAIKQWEKSVSILAKLTWQIV